MSTAIRNPRLLYRNLSNSSWHCIPSILSPPLSNAPHSMESQSTQPYHTTPHLVVPRSNPSFRASPLHTVISLKACTSLLRFSTSLPLFLHISPLFLYISPLFLSPLFLGMPCSIGLSPLFFSVLSRCWGKLRHDVKWCDKKFIMRCNTMRCIVV